MGYFRAENPVLHFEDVNGRPLVGGMLYIYKAGTNTPETTYRDAEGQFANEFPIVLNERGECVCFMDSEKSYKMVLKDNFDTVIWEADNIKTQPGGVVFTGNVFSMKVFTEGDHEPDAEYDPLDEEKSNLIQRSLRININGEMAVIYKPFNTENKTVDLHQEEVIWDEENHSLKKDLPNGERHTIVEVQNAIDASGKKPVNGLAVADFVYGILRGSVKVYDDVSDLPAVGQEGIQYYVKTGVDSYDLYVWAYVDSDSEYEYVKVSSGTVDLTDYVNALTTSGSGSVMKNLTKSGSTLTATFGDLGVADINGLSDALTAKQDALSKTGSKYNISISGNADTATEATNATTASNYANGGTIASELSRRLERLSVNTYNNGTKRVKIMSFSVASGSAGSCSEIIKFANVYGTGRTGSSVTLLVEVAWREGEYNVNARILNDTGWNFKSYVPNVAVIGDGNTRNVYIGFCDSDTTTGYVEMLYVRTYIAVLYNSNTTITPSVETTSLTSGQVNNFLSPEYTTPLQKYTTTYQTGSHTINFKKPNVLQRNLNSGSHEIYLETDNGSEVHAKLRLYTATPSCCNVDVYYVDEGGESRCISIYSRDFESAFGNCIELDVRGRNVGGYNAFRVFWES